MRALGLVLSLGLLGAGVPSASFAQGLPTGSYVNSCNSISLVSNVLEATCQTAQGNWVSAALPNASGCRYGVANSNGALVCDSPPAQPTTQTTDGTTNLTNTCSGGQTGYFGIATNNSQSKGLIILLQPGQEVQIFVMKGTSYVAGCGAQAASNATFKYFTVKPTS
jgi:hypothetical protein